MTTDEGREFALQHPRPYFAAGGLRNISGPNFFSNTTTLSPLRVVISLAMARPRHLPPTTATSTGLRFVMFLAFVRRVKQVRSARTESAVNTASPVQL